MANNLSLHDKFYNWLITPNVDIRADIYSQIGIFLSEGVRLIVVIDTLTKIAQERSGKRKNSKTKFLESIYNNFVTSGKLSSALKASGNPPETDIITAGEESGRLIDILLFTAKILTSEKEVKSVIRSAMVYPMVLITALLLTLFYSGYSIAPTLEHSVKGLVWHGASALYFSVSKFVDSPYILIIFAIIGIIVGIIWWSM
jgi:type II secretory pathway component PulF